MTAEQIFFVMFALGAVGGCLGVLASRNPVNSALSLVVAFFFLAGHYVLLQAHFMAILQILVYAGAIMVVFIFVLMLLNLHDDELGKARVNATKVLAVFVSGVLATVLVSVSLDFRDGAMQLGWPSVIDTEFGQIHPIGMELMTEWVFPFELVSILLLVGIVSAVVVAKKRL